MLSFVLSLGLRLRAFRLLGGGNARSFGKILRFLSVLNVIHLLVGCATLILSLIIVQTARSVRSDQAVFTVTDEIRSACAAKRVDNGLSVFGAEILKERTLFRFFFLCFGNEYGFFRVGIKTCIEHTSGDRSGGGIEILYLLGVETFFFEEECELDGVCGLASRMRRHEIRNKILLHVHALGELIEAVAEFFINLNVGLAHGVQNVV